MDMIRSLVADRPVVIFSKSNCCISYSIKKLISSFGANPVVYELDEMANGQQIERVLMSQLGCKPSVPAVFIGGNFVGGSKAVMTLNLSQQLVPKLIDAGAIWVWRNN